MNPHSPQYVYSVLPREFQNSRAIYTLLIIFEYWMGLVYCVPMTVNPVLHNEVLSGLLHAGSKLRVRSASTLREIEDSLEYYFRFEFLVKEFNHVMGLEIGFFVGCFMPAVVLAHVVLVRHFEAMNTFSVLFALIQAVFPPILSLTLYCNLYRLSTTSVQFLNRLKYSIDFIVVNSSGNFEFQNYSRALYLQKLLQRARPLRICVRHYKTIGPMFGLAYIGTLTFYDVRLLFVLNGR